MKMLILMACISCLVPPLENGTLARKDYTFDCGNEDFLEYVKDIQNTETGIYAVENMKCRVLKFDHNLKMQLQIGSKGEGPGELMQPHLLSVYKDTIAVLDQRGFTFFGTDGKYQSRFRMFSFVTSFVYVQDKLFVALAGLKKDHYGFIYNKEGEQIGSFGEKFFYKDGTPEMRKNYDADRYYSHGELLSDGKYIYHISARFGRIEKFDLEGKSIAGSDLDVGANYRNIVASNKDMLQNGRKKFMGQGKGWKGMVSNQFRVFKDAALLGDHIFLFGEEIFPLSDNFTEYTYAPVSVVNTDTLAVEVRKTTIDPKQNLQSATSFSSKGQVGLLCVFSDQGVPKPITLLEARP